MSLLLLYLGRGWRPNFKACVSNTAPPTHVFMYCTCMILPAQGFWVAGARGGPISKRVFQTPHHPTCMILPAQITKWSALKTFKLIKVELI